MFLSSSMILRFVVELGTAGSRIWDRSGFWKLLNQQNRRKPTDYWTGWVQQLEFLFLGCFLYELNKQPCGDMIKQKTSLSVLFATSDAACFLTNDTAQPMTWTPLENFRDFVFRNRCSVQILQKKMSELVSITNLLRQTSLEFGNCKIWSCLWVSHASSNQKRLGHLERLDLYLQYPDTTRTLKIANASHLKMVFVQTQQIIWEHNPVGFE